MLIPSPKKTKSYRIKPIVAALLVLFLSVGARIPTKLCHCHESKQSSQDQSKPVCPFSELRGLAGSFLVAEPTIIEPELVSVESSSLYQSLAAQSFELTTLQRCRSPPTLVS
jgi:hypothetical protein